jgi:archaeosine-15-forming tRNA-guanine transglycosylase
MAVFGAEEILSVEGGKLLRGQQDAPRLRVTLPDRSSPRTTVVLHLTPRKK